MKSLLLVLLSLSVSHGDHLRCYHCVASPTPCMSSTQSCALPDQRCFEGVTEAAGVLVYSAGCASPSECDVTKEIPVENLTISMKTSCCSTDLCNGDSDVPANGLQCYHCPASQTPCRSGAYMCTGANTQCLTRVVEAAGVRFTETGCAVPHDCKMNVDQTILGQTVSVKYSCCSTNLCNAAAGVRMPLVTGAALAFAWLAYLV
uniref:Phospholipase A2 inhibitor subunit gamma B-like protein n=1 Tax=Callorhinchus milii TaxID=7868 RepID=V9LCY6_CALMI